MAGGLNNLAQTLGKTDVNGALIVTLAAGSAVVTSITGTANQITASASTGAVTLSIPSVFIAPGSIASVGNILTGALLQLVGATSAFPALKRSGTDVRFRLADDSSDTNMIARDGTFTNNVDASTSINTPLYKAGGTSGVATFGPAAVASITVKGGIITAIS